MIAQDPELGTQLTDCRSWLIDLQVCGCGTNLKLSNAPKTSAAICVSYAHCHFQAVRQWGVQGKRCTTEIKLSNRSCCGSNCRRFRNFLRRCCR